MPTPFTGTERTAPRCRECRHQAAAQVKPPAGLKTAAPKMMEVLTQKRDDLKALITDVRAQIEAARAA